MRRLVSAAALVCAALALPAPASAAPAKPFDFELRARSADAAAASAAPSIALRVRRARGWSRWQALGSHTARSSDPLWVGRASTVQYRLSRPVRGLRLHFVNVASQLRRVRAVAAQDPQPGVVSRAEWGAAACPPRATPGYGAVKAVNVHHTVSLNDYSPTEAPGIVLAVCRYHRNSNGWNDIGYNALVDKYGVLYEGRAGGLDQPVIGAQAQGFNAETAGIASIADHTTVGATPETLNALAAYIRWKLQIHGQPLFGPVTLTSAGGSASRYPAGRRVALERVIGHRDTGLTACPGELLYAQLAELRALVASGVPALPSASTRLSATLADFRVGYRELVPVTGLLTGPGGALASEIVEVQVNGDGVWKTSAAAATASDGVFATALRPRKRLYVRLRYRGRAGLRRASSARLLLHVRPLIRLSRAASVGRPGAPVAVRGRVAPRKRALRLVLQQRVRGSWRKVGARSVRVRRGRFSTSFVPAFAARYRYALIAPSDEDTDRGSTGWLSLSTNPA